MRPPLAALPRVAVSPGAAVADARWVAEETAIAFVYDGASHAVMMASPADLIDFAVGFSLSEGVVQAPGDIVAIEIVDRQGLGVELKMVLASGCASTQDRRRRRMAGPVGCGLCGIESLAEAARPAPVLDSDLVLDPAGIERAMAALQWAQKLNRQAHALHAAGFWHGRDGLRLVREDVGRHNALDKLHGAVARAGHRAEEGAVLLTSRVSVEMVQKAARMRSPIVIAISAPTALAVRTAEACGITLVAVARGDRCEVYTHGWRVLGRAAAPVAAGAAELAGAMAPGGHWPDTSRHANEDESPPRRSA